MNKNKSVKFENSNNYFLAKRRKKLEKRYKLRVNLIKYIPCVPLFLVGGPLWGSLLCLAWIVVSTIFFDHSDIVIFKPQISIWFGVPGSGKTSVAAWLASKSKKHKFKVLSNVQIDGCYKLDEEDLGKYDFSFGGQGCHVIYDEANISGLDNRLHTDFAKSNKPNFFALHRHMGVRVDVFSQAYDIDKRVRDRAGSSGLFYLQRLGIPGLVCYRKIKRILFINKEDKQMIDGFEYKGLPRICFTRSVWHSFDTLDLTLCPQTQKHWELW